MSAITPSSRFLAHGAIGKAQNSSKIWYPFSTLNSFFRCAAHLNTLRGVRLCYPSFASAIPLYFSFCGIGHTRPFPVRESVALQRIALFKHGATCRSYVNFLRKACYYLGGLLTGFPHPRLTSLKA